MCWWDIILISYYGKEYRITRWLFDPTLLLGISPKNSNQDLKSHISIHIDNQCTIHKSHDNEETYYMPTGRWMDKWDVLSHKIEHYSAFSNKNSSHMSQYWWIFGHYAKFKKLITSHLCETSGVLKHTETERRMVVFDAEGEEKFLFDRYHIQLQMT